MAEIELREANPWWADPRAIDTDPAIVGLERSLFQRQLGARYRFDANDHIYTLRGPRRVGKTTLLMQEIRRLVREEGVQPSSITVSKASQIPFCSVFGFAYTDDSLYIRGYS